MDQVEKITPSIPARITAASPLAGWGGTGWSQPDMMDREGRITRVILDPRVPAKVPAHICLLLLYGWGRNLHSGMCSDLLSAETRLGLGSPLAT